MQSLEERLARLEQEFFTNGGGEKSYLIGDIFDIKDWVYGKNRQYESIYQEEKEGTIPVISGITQNNGINYYTSDKLDENEIFENEITISTRGEHSGTTFYHSGKFALANNILVLKLKGLNKFHKLYLATCFSKLKYGGYNNYPTINSLKEDIITLPTLGNGELAYDYMEDYIKEIETYHIKEIETYHIKEIEAYLKATGLSDYELTENERLALQNILSSPSKKFRLDELFEVSYGNVDIQKTDIGNQGDIVVSAGENNYGIIGRTTKQANIFDEKTITIDMFGYAFLRTFQYKMVTHGRVLSLKPKNKLFNDSLLYVLGLLKKTIHGYGFDNMLTWKKIKENLISLPVSEIGEIDFNCINSFIKANQKLAIKDLVDNINKKLETYKQVI